MILLKIPILGDIVDFIALLMGYIMRFLFFITGEFNIGLCIILFTIVVRLLMMPMTIKQQRFSKLSSMMQPELLAVQNKYKGKNDTASMQKMQMETRAIYEKYGTSPTGGCLQMFIQLPIFYGIFAVVRNIPKYVPAVKSLFTPIIEAVMGVDGFAQKLIDCGLTSTEYTTSDELLTFFNSFSADQWDILQESFGSISGVIAQYSDQIVHINNFFGINLATAPGFKISIALLIPLLAGITQWLSVKLMQGNQPQNDNDNNTAAQSMKMMNTMMPIISAVFCISMPSGLGLYWIMGSVVQCVQQIFINKYMDKVDVEKLVAKNLEKVNAKRAKQGLPPKKVDTSAVNNYQETQKKKEEEIARRGDRAKEIKDSTEYYNQTAAQTSAKPGSLAAKANMVKMYNEKNSKK